MCDNDNDNGGMGPGGMGGGGIDREREERARDKHRESDRHTGIGLLDDLDMRLQGKLGNQLAPGAVAGPGVGIVANIMGAVPDNMKSPGGPLGDSRQGSNSNGQSAETQRGQTIITAAAKKEDDTRRVTRGKTILTAPNIRKPVLSKKEPLGVSGTLG